MKKSDCFCSIEKLHKSKNLTKFLNQMSGLQPIHTILEQKNGHEIIGQYLTQPATVQCFDMS